MTEMTDFFKQPKKNLFFLTLACAFCCSGFLFSSRIDILKYAILTFSVLAIATNFRNKLNAQSFNQLKQACIPWLPLFLGLCVLMIVHGSHGYSIYINALAIYCLSFLALNHQFHLSRQTVITVLAVNALVVSASIIFHYFMWGIVDAGFWGINKNKLVPGTTLLMVCCATELCLNASQYSSTKKLIIGLIIIVSLIAIVLSEVRTSLLALLVLIPVLLFFRQTDRTKILISCLVILTLIFAGFFFTGRLQQGLADLQNYQAGQLNTSWGIRLELWKLSLSAFLVKPILGWGAEAFDAIVASGMSFTIPTFHAQHFHSDYFNMLAAGGLIGFLGWMTTVFMTIKTAFKDPCRVSLIIAALAMGTCERFWFNNPSTLFLLMTAWLLLTLSQPNSFKQESK